VPIVPKLRDAALAGLVPSGLDAAHAVFLGLPRLAALLCWPRLFRAQQVVDAIGLMLAGFQPILLKQD